MSAADPATPERPYLNKGAHGSVIDITKHRGRGAMAAARGRWTTVSTPASPGGDHNRSDLELVADDVEKWFLEIERSLTNKDTAAVYLRTLDVVEHILRAAVAQELITEEQRLKLADLFDAAKQAPGLV